MARSTPEWVGRTDDERPPPRVRVRVFQAHGGVCHLSGRKIIPGEPWELDHIKALTLGGENRETNLAPALRDKHKVKTAEDVKLKSEAYQKQAKHLGVKHKKKPMNGSRLSPWKRKMDGTTERRG